MGETEITDRVLGPIEDLHVHRLRLIGRAERVELDLVELVDAQQATGVAPGRPGLAAIATGVGHESHRQLGLVEYLAGDHRRERHLGRGDRPEVIAFEVVRVVAELRKVAGADHRVGLHDRRRTDLLEGIAIAIEAVVDERAQEMSTGASVHGEHRTGHLHRSVDIEDAELFADLPMGDPLMFGVAARVVVFDAHDDVVVFSEAVGRIWGRHVRNVEQLLAKRSLEFVGLGGERLLSLPERLALVLQRARLIALAVAMQRPDLFRQGIDPASDVVAFGTDRPNTGIEFDRTIDPRGVVASASDRRFHGVRVGAQQLDVEHGQTVSPAGPGGARFTGVRARQADSASACESTATRISQ